VLEAGYGIAVHRIVAAVGIAGFVGAEGLHSLKTAVVLGSCSWVFLHTVAVVGVGSHRIVAGFCPCLFCRR